MATVIIIVKIMPDSPSTDLEKNVIIWTIGQMPIARYAVLTYQIKSPTSTATTGALNYATSWDSGRRYNETTSYVLSTLNYTGEAGQMSSNFIFAFSRLARFLISRLKSIIL